MANVRLAVEGIARELDLNVGRTGLRAHGRSSGGRITVTYFTGNGAEGSLPLDDHRWVVRFKRRWSHQRITVARTRPLRTDRQIHRLERRLADLSPQVGDIVVEILHDLDGVVRIDRSGMTTSMPPTTSPRELVERVRVTIAYIERLSAAS
jgi:hypothetical protein